VIVAIDGPAGAGKSSVARAVARALGMTFVDTGAMYRAVALLALEEKIPLDDDGALAAAVRRCRLEVANGRVVLDGRDVGERIRDPDVTAAVSRVAAHAAVRNAMAALQRDAAARGDVVMEGRDIGSTVAPEADVKVFLTASLDERARRRLRDDHERDDEATHARVAAAIAARDAADSSRRASPLAKPPDAIELDTTDMTFEEVVAEVVRLAEERGHG
jgi:CMP/dCMP kinase